MVPLNLPVCELRLKNSENKQWVYDILRKKFILLTPEEWVRQHVIHLLKNHYGYSLSLMAVEKKIEVNGTPKRFDLVVFNNKGSIFLAVECKAPDVPINQEVFDQIARYNMTLQATYLMVTNGLQHYFCQMDYEQQQYRFLKDLPKQTRLSTS